MDFAELNAYSNYSFLEGASFPEEMVFEAHQNGYSGIAITDKKGVYGVPRAHRAAKTFSLSLIVGAEVPLFPDFDGILLCENRNGYGNLCELLTELHTKETFSLFSEKRNDLILLLPVHPKLADYLPTLQGLFPESLYLIASHFFDGRDLFRLAREFSKKYTLPVVASNRPLFHFPKRKPLQDVLRCIQHTATLKEAGFRLLPNHERYVKPLTEIKKLFQGHLDWIKNTLEVAGRCHFSLDEIRYRYPSEWLPVGETGDSYLEKLVWQGAERRYGERLTLLERRQIVNELSLIKELEYADYFLTIWDITQFAKSQKILYQGRGSAANSIVCYLLEITAIDPIRLSLLFERFLSRERREPPDIDIDFEHERREEVIQYIYNRYGRDRAAITAENICFRRRSATREVVKVFGATPQEITEEKKQILSLIDEIRGFPRHLGTHVGGFVLCQDLLSRNVPIQNTPMPNRSIVQWDKNDLDDLGFTRVDILGLGILTCIRKTFEIIEKVYGTSFTLATIPAEDPAVYAACSRGDTIGVFQIESRAQMNMLPRLKPTNFYDLVVEISLVRPGPIQAEMVHPYLRRREGKEKIEYPQSDLKVILEKTFGVPLFQEQIMKMAMVVAGFTGGEADELRRAMGTWKRDGKGHLSRMGEKFRQGLIKKGIPEDFAKRIFSQVEGFAEYGFPESHAASFAILAYATAYLKYYYPDAYLCGLLNSQPMGFYRASTLIHDAQRHGVKVRPITVNQSRWDNQVEEKGNVRLGFREIRGLSSQTGKEIEKARPYTGILDFVEKMKKHLYPKVLTKRELFLLAGANAFDVFGLSRREMLWEIQGLSLVDSPYFSPEEIQTELPQEEPWEKITLDYGSQGLSLFQHPMEYLRTELKLRGMTDSQLLNKTPPGRRVTVAGVVICRQRPPTASGVLFVTLEDEFGFINLVVWSQVFERYERTLLENSFLYCEGKIQRAEGTNVIHVIVEEAYPLLLKPEKSIPIRSYDFH